jgi:hypothetical protein
MMAFRSFALNQLSSEMHDAELVVKNKGAIFRSEIEVNVPGQAGRAPSRWQKPPAVCTDATWVPQLCDCEERGTSGAAPLNKGGCELLEFFLTKESNGYNHPASVVPSRHGV